MDARKLLREQRAARQIKHPHAAYSSSGLRCSVCHLQIKTESLWDSHVKSAQHLANLKQHQLAERLKSQQTPTTRKRKASDSSDEGRKKIKNTLPEIPEDAELSIDAEAGAEPALPQNDHQQAPAEVDGGSASQPAPADDEDWNAFVRDMKELEDQRAQAKLREEEVVANATISAPAQTPAEIAAQARQEQSQQRTRREDELREEKEEAQDNAADELERMELFEARIQALRQRKAALARPDVEVDTVRVDDEGGGKEEEDEEEEEDDDIDGFWTR